MKRPCLCGKNTLSDREEKLQKKTQESYLKSRALEVLKEQPRKLLAMG